MFHTNDLLDKPGQTYNLHEILSRMPLAQDDLTNSYYA